MSMSRKEFVAFANEVNRIGDNTLLNRQDVAVLVADVCVQFNERFNRLCFYAACRVSPSIRKGS